MWAPNTLMYLKPVCINKKIWKFDQQTQFRQIHQKRKGKPGTVAVAYKKLHHFDLQKSTQSSITASLENNFVPECVRATENGIKWKEKKDPN